MGGRKTSWSATASFDPIQQLELCIWACLLGYVWEDDGYDLRVVVGLGNPRLLRSLLVMIIH